MVEALGDGARGVELVAERLQPSGYFEALFAALFRDLVAYRPHDDRGVVAVGEDEVGDILISPVVEEAGVAVFALGIDPHVEALGHDHHA